jgi:hypothetical protein
MRGIMRDLYNPESGNVQQTTPVGEQAPIQQGGGFGQNIPSTVGQQGVLNQPITTIENMPKEIRELPAIVKETIVPQQVTQVQPVIHRDREQVEVHKIMQPLHERDIAPTQVQHATLPQEVRQPVRMPDTQFQEQYRAAPIQPQTVYTPAQTTTVQKQPIVEETVHRKIIEEVQPVLYKEVVRPTVIQQTRPIYETFVESPQLFTEERPLRDLGIHVLPSQFQQRQPLTQQPLAQQPLMQQPLTQQPLTRQLLMQQPLTQQPLQQPFIQQPFGQQPFNQRTPSQVGLVGLPPRDVIPSTQLFGDNTGYGTGRARDVGTGISPPLAQQPLAQQPLTQQPLAQQPLTQQPLTQQPLTQQPLTQQPLTQQPLTQQPLTQQSFAQQPLTQQPLTQQPLTQQPLAQQSFAQQPTGVIPGNIPAEKGLGSLQEEILKVEYEVRNITEGAPGEPYVERTVTKLQPNVPLTETLSGGSNIGKAATINQPQTI